MTREKKSARGCMIVFYRLSRRQSVRASVTLQGRTLLTGSILELLVATFTHIAARERTECSAGIGSFIGLSLGMSVMLFAFGPGAFLFLARRRRLHPPSRDSWLPPPPRLQSTESVEIPGPRSDE
jgi:hypothetical protein